MGYKVYKITVGALQTNCYILADEKSKRCMIIDPGGDYKEIKRFIDSNSLVPSFIVNTHGHADHIMANDRFDVPVYMHKADADFLSDPDKNLAVPGFLVHKKPERFLEDGEIIELGDLDIKVLHTPGHTPGGICLLCNGVLFSGDTLFASGVGRTDLPGGNTERLFESIRKKLFTLDDNVKVYPGHGPATTIGKEKKENFKEDRPG